jgi:hypothetical protein
LNSLQAQIARLALGGEYRKKSRLPGSPWAVSLSTAFSWGFSASACVCWSLQPFVPVTGRAHCFCLFLFLYFQFIEDIPCITCHTYTGFIVFCLFLFLYFQFIEPSPCKQELNFVRFLFFGQTAVQYYPGRRILNSLLASTQTQICCFVRKWI